jgi:hypothetical protein
MFKELTRRVDSETKRAQAYLDALPFLPNDEVCERLCTKAWEIFEAHNEDFDAVPWWVAQIADYHIPYGPSHTRNGSLAFAMGFSPVAKDARLRNLLEIAEGRETAEVDFVIVTPFVLD